MLKNTAGQVIGAQMVSASDGSAFTDAVTVSVTVDGGTQATGSVGSGACTHEGNGFHTYAPAQSETNGDHIAFTFTGTGAVPVTVQVYTRIEDPERPTGAVVDDESNTAETFETNLDNTEADAYEDAWCLFTSGDLAGQCKPITGYDESSKFLTIGRGGFSAEPAAGDTFLIINR